jgi:cobalt/nickel transport system permease protein
VSGAHHNSDGFAWSSSFLARIDPRVKLAAVAGFLCVNLLARTALVPAVIAAAMVLLMLASRAPYRRQLLMIAFPSTFAIFVVASQTVFHGGSVFATLGPFDLHRDGMLHGFFLSLRIVAGGLVVVVLGVSTPLNRLCLALKWFRAPATFVEVIQLTYRYLFDMRAEFFRMRDAQRSRLGWSSARHGLASSRMLGGALFLDVYERGLRSAEAMRCRGAGPVAAGSLPRLSRLDLGAALASAALVMVLAVPALMAVGP